MKTTALIMAGGRGERFWPKSRKNLPKQFLSLTDDERTMIQLTVDRISPLVEKEDIYISTNKDYYDLVREQLPEIPECNVICEPVGRNTAPCIGMGALHVLKKYEDAQMIVLPSDHLIRFNRMFIQTIKDAMEISESGENLVTIGITPSYPETGYGYIKFDAASSVGHAFAVERMVEKPELSVAKEYLNSAEYLWNSGMFVWRASSIMNSIEKLLPDIKEKLDVIGASIGTDSYEEVFEKEFFEMKSISIDYGVLEKADNMYVVPGSFGWDDVGSWLAVGRIKKTNENGNVVNGNVITIDSENNIIQGENKLIAAIGLKDMIIVDTEDAMLICDKDKAGDVKRVLENLRICNRDEYI